jgi:hypothetical protein
VKVGKKLTVGKKQKRLRFDTVEVLSDAEGRYLVEVAFTFAASPIRVSATASEDAQSQLRAAALATLDAVRQAADDRFSCQLQDLDRVNALGKDLVAVLVNIDFAGKQLQVFGSCPVTGNEIDAAVKAALNATNRLFELATREQ